MKRSVMFGSAVLGAGLALVLVLLVGLAPSAGAGGGVTTSLVSGRLTVTGTAANDTIVVRAISASTIEVASFGASRRFRAGAVSRIRVLGGGGDDSLSIQDGQLAFTITRPTTLDGGPGNDTLLGGRGPERFFGGTGNDTATGAGGNDTITLGAGTDTSLWTRGAGTDTVDGGADADLQRATGTGNADAFVLAQDGTRARVGIGSTGARVLGVENVEVLASGGADTAQVGSVTGTAVSSVSLQVGPGTDSVTFAGTAGPNAITAVPGAAGTTTVTGLTGAAPVNVAGTEALHVSGGDGADALTATPQSLPITYGGGNGIDDLAVTGTSAADTWAYHAAGTHLQVVEADTPRIDATTIETLSGGPGGGIDDVTVEDLTSAGITDVDLGLGTGGMGDAAADVVTVLGTAGDDGLQAAANGLAVQVTGGFSTVELTNTEAANDTLELHALDGHDTLAGGSLSTLIGLELEGGEGDDDLTGGNGADFLDAGPGDDDVNGNQGADTAFLGDGADQFVWNPGDGSDVVEGQGGIDRMHFDGSAGPEIFAASANGGRLEFTRNVGPVVMDVDGLEVLEVNALGGNDSLTVNNLAATDVTDVEADLGVSGAGDLAADAITLNGAAGEDFFQATILGGELVVRTGGLDVTVLDPELANDTLTVNGGGGNDVIVAGTGTNLLDYTFNGGDNDDVIIGSAGGDTIDCGANTDFANGGAGTDSAANCETTVNIP